MQLEYFGNLFELLYFTTMGDFKLSASLPGHDDDVSDAPKSIVIGLLVLYTSVCALSDISSRFAPSFTPFQIPSSQLLATPRSGCGSPSPNHLSSLRTP